MFCEYKASKHLSCHKSGLRKSSKFVGNTILLDLELHCPRDSDFRHFVIACGNTAYQGSGSDGRSWLELLL
jgi:hypothetical protein